MSADVVKVPVLGLEVPKPKKWDFVALAITLVGVVASVANITASGVGEPGASIGSPMSIAFAMAGLLVSMGSLLVLGKTAKEGTIHGNLLAVAGMGVGLGGAMLAAALWAVA